MTTPPPQATVSKMSVDTALAILGVTAELRDGLRSVVITAHSVTLEHSRRDARGIITTVLGIDRDATGPAADPNYYGPVAIDPPSVTP